MATNFHVVLEKASSNLQASEIGEFLNLLTLAYNRARAIAPRERNSLLSLSSSTLGEILKDKKVLLKAGFLQHGPKLRCSKIIYGSPFEIWLTGTASALVLAVILAGGEFKGPGFTIKINKSLGASLNDLRKALYSTVIRRPQTTPPRRPTVIPDVLKSRKKSTKALPSGAKQPATRVKKKELPDV